MMFDHRLERIKKIRGFLLQTNRFYILGENYIHLMLGIKYENTVYHAYATDGEVVFDLNKTMHKQTVRFMWNYQNENENYRILNLNYKVIDITADAALTIEALFPQGTLITISHYPDNKNNFATNKINYIDTLIEGKTKRYYVLYADNKDYLRKHYPIPGYEIGH